MLMAEEWLKTWICLSFLLAWARAARPRFDVSTDMGMVLVPADAEVDTAIFRLRATDQDADFPLVFEIIATTTAVVRIENLPCTFYNKICQANVILTRRLVPGRLHDFIVRVRDSTGDMNSMQATISVTNATTPRDRIFPHLPTLVMVPEDTKPEKELDYLLVESNPWSGKPVYIELWQPKELFKIKQRQVGSQTKGIITLIGELDFETQSMYTLTMYATDPYTEPGKDTRNIAGINVVVAVVDVQDVPPIFTLAPPLTKINNSVKPGDVILRVHAEDGDKGVPRQVTYGLISEGNPFTPFFNVSESTGEIILTRALEELTKITHVGAPIILKIVAEEIRSTRDEPPAQATVVELGLLLGEPGNSPPYFENDNYVAWIDENALAGTVIVFSDAYSTRVKDEDIGKAGVFALKLENNNGTFEISPAVAERSASFVITVRDNSLIDYEKFRSLRFRIVAQEVGPATNLSTSVPVSIFLRDLNDNPPVFDLSIYQVTLPENANAGTKVLQVHATDKDAGVFGRIQYVKITGSGSEAFQINPDTGLITISMGSLIDREQTAKLELSIEARDEDGRGLKGLAELIVNIIDVNDNAPIFERGIYEFILNSELTNFSMSAFIKATDADAEAPNNAVRYEIVHGNYDNKFQLNEITGQLMLREPIGKVRKIRSNLAANITSNRRNQSRAVETTNNATTIAAVNSTTTPSPFKDFHLLNNLTSLDVDKQNQSRRRRAEDTPLFILTARAYDLGVPHLSSVTQIRILRPMSALARIVMFVMPGENPDPKKTAETLATITGSRVTIMEIKPYVAQADPGNTDPGKRSVVVARVEQYGPGTLVDVDKIRASLAENGFGIISGMDGTDGQTNTDESSNNNNNNSGSSVKDASGTSMIDEEVTVYKTENKLLTWLLVLLGLLILAALITTILCCVCSSCPFYMEPRKRRIHSSETLIIRSDGLRPKRNLQRKPIKADDRYYNERKEAWSADPERQQWQFNRRNTNNLGISSLPGDARQSPQLDRTRRAGSLRQYDAFGEVLPQDRMYMEDVEAQRSLQQAEIDSLRRHELDRGSDRVLAANARQQRLREQHYYREGNAEVLRLLTRGDIEDGNVDRMQKDLYHQANGKDILLQRFIEDQKLRRSQDLRDVAAAASLHELEVDRSIESHHQRANELTEILILPERLELQRQPSYPQRPHDQMVNVEVQRLLGKDEDADDYRSPRGHRSSTREAEGDASFGMHDAELMRQNALLTRLLLEKEGRTGLNAPNVDSSSFLETQSLPGQVAIATQTDRTASTQTECFARSRSDNEESEEDPRLRRKPKGRSTAKLDSKQIKTIWLRSPIPEESRVQSANNKKLTPSRTKIEVSETRKLSISPDVLKEIRDSLESDNDEVEEPKTSKTKQSRIDDDSTTPSPENKDKTATLKSKARKKQPEKPVRASKLAKGLESEKSHFMEPSFRVLEREISSFQQKIRQFGDKKLKLLKRDEGKQPKESEDDSGATYDVSNKCEISVKRTNRSLSRETSPTKISVERKSKTSQDDNKSRRKLSSSDLDDSDKSPQQQVSSFSERTTQYESSRAESRSRSQLRRQANFTKSSSDKIQDSKSSSSDLKLDSTDLAKNKAPTKLLQSQRSVTKRILLEPKRRLAAATAKSKATEQKTKRAITTSDESKLSSPAKKSINSENEKSKVTSSSDDKSQLSNAIGIDIDRLVQDVRGVVKKELEAARHAMNEPALHVKNHITKHSSKSDESATESKSQKNETSKTIEPRKSPTKSLDSFKKDTTSLQKTIQSKEKKDQSMKEKSKSVGSTPPKGKIDEAVTFIVFENDKIRRDPTPTKSDKQESKPRESMQSIEIISKPFEIKSEKVTDKTNDIANKVVQSKNSVSNSIDEATKIISNEIAETENQLITKIEQAKLSISDKLEESKQNISSEIENSKQSVSKLIDEAKSSVSDQIDESKRDISNSFEDIKQTSNNIIDETKQSVSEKIEQNQNSTNRVSQQINEYKQNISDRLDDTRHSISEVIDETKQNLSAKTDEVVSSKPEDSQQNIPNAENQMKQDVSEKIDEKIDNAAENASKTIEESKQSFTDESKNATKNEETDDVHEVNQTTDTETKMSTDDTSKEKTNFESSTSNDKFSESINVQETKSVTSDRKIEAECTRTTAYQCEPTPASLPNATNEGSETIADHAKNSEQSSPRKTIPETTTVIQQLTSVEESPQDTEQSTIESQQIEKTVSSENVNPPRIDKIKRSASPVKLFKGKVVEPETKVSQASIEPEESDEEDDSSMGSDISSKTALQRTTQPYGTPRHSDSEKKTDPKPRQRWDKEPLLNVQIPRTSEVNFPKKMETSPIDQSKLPGTGKENNTETDKSTAAEGTNQRKEKAESEKISHPVVVGVKRKDHHGLRTDHFSRLADARRSSTRRQTDGQQGRSNKVEIRSKHLKLQVSHHYRQTKDTNDEAQTARHSTATTTTSKSIEHAKDPEIVNARSRYMAWYQQKRTEMEQKRREKKQAEDEQTRTKWMKKPSVKSRKSKSAQDPEQTKTDAKQESLSRERAKSSSEAAENSTARVARLRIRPLVNVESEQLKAIVRQGRKLRKKEGGTDEDLTVQIFAPEKPPVEKIEDERLSNALQLEPRHHLTQHSEYKYEKSVLPAALPFYLHPPPPPPNPSPDAFHDEFSDNRRLDDDLDSGIAVSLQSGATRLKHQQVLEKKSVFDIAYNEAAPTQLRSDSSTPPS